MSLMLSENLSNRAIDLEFYRILKNTDSIEPTIIDIDEVTFEDLEHHAGTRVFMGKNDETIIAKVVSPGFKAIVVFKNQEGMYTMDLFSERVSILYGKRGMKINHSSLVLENLFKIS